MRLSELINGVYTKSLPDPFRDIEVRIISCDSREEQKDGLFVALSGAKFNGEDYVKDALVQGARIIVKKGDSRLLNNVRIPDHICVLDVDDPKYFLYCIGQRFFDHPSHKINCVGITGTNGKTTISYLIESIIHAAAKSCGVIGTINYRIGERVIPSKNTTPGFLDNQRYLAQLAGIGVDYCVMEASSHALDQGRLEGIKFSAGIFTNLTQDHLDYHTDMESYFNAKSLLFSGLSSEAVAIINMDDVYGQRLLPKLTSRVLTYAFDKPADIHAKNITYQLSGSHFEIVFPEGMIKLHSRFIGEHNIYNILAAFAWGLSQHISPEIIRRGIEKLAYVPGRLESVDNDKGYYIFIDYAHTED